MKNPTNTFFIGIVHLRHIYEAYITQSTLSLLFPKIKTQFILAHRKFYAYWDQH